MSLWDRIGRLFAREASGALATDAFDNTDEAYRALTDAGLEQVSPAAMERYRKLARRIYFTHAIGGPLPDMIVARVLGAGLAWTANDQRVQDVVARFVTDPDNDLEQHFPRMVTEFLAYGELFLPIFLTRANADVRLGYLTPDQVEEVVWRQGDAKKPVAFIQRRPSATESRRLWVIPHPEPAHDNRYPPHPALTDTEEPHSRPGEDGLPVALPSNDGELAPEIAALFEKDPDLKVAGYAFYHRTGCLVSGRGRGLYERVRDWMKAVDDFLFGTLRNAVLQARYLFECTLKGANKTQVDARKKDLQKGPPPPGSILVHNENEDWKVLSPDVTPAAQVRELFTGGLKLVGLAVGLPGHEVGAEDDTNRSTAKESRSVSINRAKRFQREVAAVLKAWIGYQVEQKVHAGMLPAEVDRTVEPVLPELDARDEGEVAKSVADGVNAMATAVDRELVLEEDARAFVYSLMGREVPDAEEFRAALEKARKERDEAGYGADGRLEGLIRQLAGQKSAGPGTEEE